MPAIPTFVSLLHGLISVSLAAEPSGVPSRTIPGSVLVELQSLENRFELALAQDCAVDQCYSNGCAYVDHAVADQPRARSLPGLSTEAGPSETGSQEYLTRAECTFSHESTVDAADAAAMVRRLQTRLTQGWTVVTVQHQALPPIPSKVAPVEEEVAPVEPVEAPVEAPPEWTVGGAWQELWATLLPDAWWMVGLGLGTLAGTTLIWAWRRVGRASLEEQALLAQLAQPVEGAAAGETPDAPQGPSDEEADRAYVTAQDALWRTRLANIDPSIPDPELAALIRERLRAGDLPLLAKAVLRFPEGFPAAFPQDGETAAAKLDLAELLQTVDASSLPSDAAFFRALERHALAAALASQPDAAIVRSLRQDFGSAGLVELIGQLPARMGALLFALAPPAEQHEAVRLLGERQVTALSQQLLRSNRMDPAETTALFEVLRSARSDAPGPSALPAGEITDRGTTFDAPGALAVLLPRLAPARRAALFEEALARFQGSLPLWHREIFLADMLFALDTEARADLLLGVEVEPLAAWISLLDPALSARLLEGVPESLRLTLRATPSAPSRAAQLALAGRGRRALGAAFQRQLTRAGLSFERVVAAAPVASA